MLKQGSVWQVLLYATAVLNIQSAVFILLQLHTQSPKPYMHMYACMHGYNVVVSRDKSFSLKNN